MDNEQATQIFVGRQPIFNRQQNVVAYELLYRANMDNQALFGDGDLATSEVIINSVLDIGLHSIVGKRTAFFNLTGNFIRGDHPLPLDNRQVVLEILEDVVPDEKLIEGMRELARQKFIIALDDFEYRDELAPLLEIAHIVKLEVMGRSREDLEQRIAQLRPFKLKLLAEKVESHEEFELCKALGFDYFQGYFLCRPNVIEGKSLPANRLVIMRLLASLQAPDIDMEELEQLIIQDVSLTYRLLRYINSAALSLPNKIDSVHRALLMIGVKTIKNWVSLLLLSRIDNKPMELMRTALIRARMCELLAEQTGHRAEREQYFTCGLFSVLDALMDRPLSELLDELPLSEHIKLAVNEYQGELGHLLQQVIDYERGDWEALRESGISTQEYRRCYLEAVVWSDESMAALQEKG